MPVVGKPPKDFVATGVPEDFQRWLKNFETYVDVVEISATLTSAQKHALLLNCIGEDATRVISGFSYDTKTEPYKNLVKELTSHYVPQSNLTYERYRFRKLKQEGKIMPFVNELHQVAKACDFGNVKIDTVDNQNIRDQFILGLQSDELRRKLLCESDLTLEKAIRIAVSYEASVIESQEMKSKPNTLNVAASQPILTVRSRSSSPHPRFKQRSRSQSKGNVRFRDERECKDPPICYYCRKPGHFKKNCFKLQNASKRHKQISSLFLPENYR